jgi:hypothetical protein
MVTQQYIKQLPVVPRRYLNASSQGVLTSKSRMLEATHLLISRHSQK